MRSRIESDFQIRRIGIALAVYRPNIETFSEQLRTIREQSFTQWICVCAVDADPYAGAALTILRADPRLVEYFLDDRFVWIENSTRLGHKKNFECAIQEVVRQGVDAVACADQDDLWYPEKLETTRLALERVGRLALVHSDMHIRMEPFGELLPQTAWRLEKRGIRNVSSDHFYVRNVVAGASMLFDVELARRFPVIPPGAEYHDHWYALVASYLGGVHPVDQALFAYRQHTENVVGVTPYRSFFWVPSGTSVAEVFKKCRRGWERTRRLAQSAVESGLPVTWRQRLVYLDSRELGVGLKLLAFRHLLTDRPLSRTACSRAIGKCMDFPAWVKARLRSLWHARIRLRHRLGAYRRLQGEGLEIGAFYLPASLPSSSRVHYADCVSREDAFARFQELRHYPLVPVQTLLDLDREGLKPFADGQFDFVILNHVLEHVANPIVVLAEVFRVVRDGGSVVLTIPDKDYTADRPRALTTWTHLLEEYREGVREVSEEHYLEFLRAVHPEVFQLPEEQKKEKVRQARERREHAHVWNSQSFPTFVERTCHEVLGMSVTQTYRSTGIQNGAEYFSVWRKESPVARPSELGYDRIHTP